MKLRPLFIDMTLLTTVVLMACGDSVRTFAPLVLRLQIPVFTDFPSYYLAAHLLNQGVSPYDTGSMQAAALSKGITGSLDYIYPPFFAVLFRPLALLSYPTAWNIWFVCNLVFLVIALVLLLQSAQLSPTVAVVVGISLATLQPVTLSLLLGQVNILLLLLFVVVVFMMNRASLSPAHRGTAGLVWGAASAIKRTPGIAFVVFLLRRECAALVAMVGAVTLLLLVGVLAGGGVATFTDWLTRGLPRASAITDEATRVSGNLSIYAVADHAFSVHHIPFRNGQGSITYGQTQPIIESPAIGNVAGYGGAGVIVCLTLLCLVLRSGKQHEAHAFLWDIALVLAALTLISPLVWRHYYVWLIIPIVALIQRHTQSRAVRLLLILAYFLLNLDASHARAIPFVPLSFLLISGFFANVLVWGLLVASTLREWQRSRPRRSVQSSPQPSPDYPAGGSAHPS